MRSLAIGLLLFAQVAFAQVTALPSNGTAGPPSGDVWTIFGGYSYAYARQGLNYSAWDASLSEYPYPSHPWIGGTIETSGGYQNQNGLNHGWYTVMGGPTFTPSTGGLRPFARVMAGGVMERTAAPSGSPSAATTVSDFGMDVGGGLDVYLSEHCGFREQGDWILYGKSGTRTNLVKAAVGVVFRF